MWVHSSASKGPPLSLTQLDGQLNTLGLDDEDDELDYSSWDFNIFLVNEDQQHTLALVAFAPYLERFDVDVDRFNRFVTAVRQSYGVKPTHEVSKQFHNYTHAMDCVQACNVILHSFDAAKKLDPIDAFAVLIAALCHDMDHPGLSNSYQNNAHTELALRYSYIATLENHSASLTVRRFRHHRLFESSTVFDTDPGLVKRITNTILASILSTDMASHSQLMAVRSLLTIAMHFFVLHHLFDEVCS